MLTLRGTEAEASSQLLRGVVVLCLPTALRIEDVHLRMTGVCRVGYVDDSATFYKCFETDAAIDGQTPR